MSDCREISIKIKKIKEIYDQIKENSSPNQKEAKILGEKKSVAEKMIKEILEEYSFGYEFIEKLKDEEFIRSILEDIDLSRIKSEGSRFFPKIFIDLNKYDIPDKSKNQLINSKMYRQFLKFFLDPKIGQIFDEKLGKKGLASEKTFIMRMLNSAFLTFSLNRNGQINLDEPLPEEINESFGMSWGHKKTINIKEAGGGLGIYMVDGRINAKKAGDAAGFMMSGGVLKIEEAGDSLGRNMVGGTIIAKKAGKYAGAMSPDSKGDGTILFEEVGTFVSSSNSKIIVCKYDPVEKEYIKFGGLTEPSKNVLPMKMGNIELEIARDRMAGVYMINDISQFSVDVTVGWGDGILVLRDLPAKNIGKGMIGGAVIIETTLSPDEVRKRLSKEDRFGGAILMRIPDPTDTDPNNTKLIDLEDDWLETH